MPPNKTLNSQKQLIQVNSIAHLQKELNLLAHDYWDFTPLAFFPKIDNKYLLFDLFFFHITKAQVYHVFFLSPTSELTYDCFNLNSSNESQSLNNNKTFYTEVSHVLSDFFQLQPDIFIDFFLTEETSTTSLNHFRELTEKSAPPLNIQENESLKHYHQFNKHYQLIKLPFLSQNHQHYLQKAHNFSDEHQSLQDIESLRFSFPTLSIHSYKSLSFANIAKNLNHLHPIDGLAMELLLWRTYEKILNIQSSQRTQNKRSILLEISRIIYRNLIFKNISQAYDQQDLTNQLQFSLSQIKSLYQPFFPTENLTSPLLLLHQLPQFPFENTFISLMDWLERQDVLKNHIESFFLKRGDFCRDFSTPPHLESQSATYFFPCGPQLRASGIGMDMRKMFPSDFDSNLDFECTMGLFGSHLDRLWIHLFEWQQSILLIRQLIDNYPPAHTLSNSITLSATEHFKKIHVDDNYIPNLWGTQQHLSATHSQTEWCIETIEAPQGACFLVAKFPKFSNENLALQSAETLAPIELQIIPPHSHLAHSLEKLSSLWPWNESESFPNHSIDNFQQLILSMGMDIF